ncbi:MAG: hypothetical protein KKF57_02925 [Firmicutes bacterium]|nr:hypothetical protein [Bacillota bacterium]
MLVSQTLPHDVAFLVCVHLKAASFAMLSPGSKALANPLGVAVSIPINTNPGKYDDNKFSYYLLDSIIHYCNFGEIYKV